MSLKSLIEKLDQLNESTVNEVSATDMDADSLAKHRSRLAREKNRMSLSMPKPGGGPRKADVPAAARRSRGESPLSLSDLREQDGKEIDYSTLEIDGIDYRDAPEFSDAYFSYGEYTDGTPLPDDVLEKLSDDGDLRYQYLEKVLYEGKKSKDKKVKDKKSKSDDRKPSGDWDESEDDEYDGHSDEEKYQQWRIKRGLGREMFEGSSVKGSRVHRGSYGAEYQGDGDDDDDDKPAKKAAPAVKRGRGRPRKDSDNTGQVKNYDTQTLSNWIIGNLPKKLPKGVSSTKHKLKDWMEHIEAEMLAENTVSENQQGQISIEPAKSNAQVIKQGTQVIGQVDNPQLANTIKQAIGQGQMTLAGTDVNEDEQIDEVLPALAGLAGSTAVRAGLGAAARAGLGAAARAGLGMAGKIHGAASLLSNNDDDEQVDEMEEAVDSDAVTDHSMKTILKMLDEYVRDGDRERVEPILSKDGPVRSAGTRSDGSQRFEPRYTGPKPKASGLGRETGGLRSDRHVTRYMEEEDAGEHSPITGDEVTTTPSSMKAMYPTGKENKMKTYDVVGDKMSDKMMYEGKKSKTQHYDKDMYDSDSAGKKDGTGSIVKRRRSAVAEESTTKRDDRAERGGKRVAKDIEYDERKRDGIHGKRRDAEDAKAERAGKRVAKDIEYDERVDEAWDTDYETPESEKGKYKGKTVADLKRMKAALMKKEKRTKTEQGKVAELNFAIRAKQADGGKWGKIKETDAQMEAWERSLSGMLMESVTVNTSTGTDPDTNSVNISATGEDAAQLMALLQNAGLHAGATASGYQQVEYQDDSLNEDSDEAKEITHENQDGQTYDGTGSPALTTKTPGEDPHTKFDDADDVPIMAMPRGMGVSQNVDDDEAETIELVTQDEVIDGLDSDEQSTDQDSAILDFIKKIMNHGGQQYGDSAPADQDYTDERVNEEDMEEGNEFSGALAKAKAAGEKDFEVDGKRYPVKEEEHYWAEEKQDTSEGYEDANWAAMRSDDGIQDADAIAYQSGADASNKDQNLSITEKKQHCDECGEQYRGNHECGENLNEWANSPTGQSEDEQFTTEMEFMTRAISGGLNNMKQDQTTLPSTRVRTGAETRGADTSLGAELKRLAGIN